MAHLWVYALQAEVDRLASSSKETAAEVESLEAQLRQVSRELAVRLAILGNNPKLLKYRPASPA